MEARTWTRSTSSRRCATLVRWDEARAVVRGRRAAEQVWDALVDVEQVAPCLPGAEITEAHEDGSYRGNFTVKLGPTTAAYRGELRLDEVDEAAHEATMHAKGQDKRGQGSANAVIFSRVHEKGDGTRVEVETDFTITGRLARFGRGGMIEDVSNRLLGDFATCLQKRIEEASADPERRAESESGAVKAHGLFFHVLWLRIKRLFRPRRDRSR